MSAHDLSSRLVLGCGYFGGRVPARTAKRLVDACLDRGLVRFDTADVYGGGASEETLRRCLGARRSKAWIMTKIGGRTGPGADGRGLAGGRVRAACESSLKRLGSDYVDALLAHQFDAHADLRETIDAFSQLAREGKIRAFGVSNFSEEQLRRTSALSSARGVALGLCQGELSPAAPPSALGVSRFCASEGIQFLAYSALANGLLVSSKRRAGRFLERDLSFIRECRRRIAWAAGRLGKSPAQVALAWALSRPGVSGVVIGVRSVAQLLELLSSPATLPNEIRRVIEAHG